MNATSVNPSKNRQFVTSKQKALINALIAVITPTITADAYTPVLGDANKTLLMDSDDPNDLVLPANADVAFPVGTKFEVIQTGAGATSIVGDTGVTVLVNAAFDPAISDENGVAYVRKIATNTWVLSGDLAASV